MQNNQSSYSRWSWIVAVALAIILLWALLTGRGPTGACCGAAATEPVASTEAIMPADMPDGAAEAFSFSASSNDFSTSGDSANVTWASNGDALKALLSDGSDLNVSGNESNVMLSGIVDSEAIKQQKGADVQAFFGSSVAVDNQLSIKAMEQPAVVEDSGPPPAAKLYFDSGRTALPNDAGTTLAPIIDWLNANANAKAVIAGFHDPRGGRAINENLAKNRANSVAEALKTAGIDGARIEMRMPEGSLEGSGDLAEARRVEVSVE